MSTTPTEDTRSKQEIRVSMLPTDLRGPVEEMKLDLDGDGAISNKELEVIIDRLIATKGDNKSLRKQLIYMGIFSILLTCIIFGVSIAAARLSKETTVDPVTGFMSTKGTDQSIHTSPVSYYLDTLDVVGMENDDLSALTDLILSAGAVELSVKGFSRSLVKNQVTFLVEGGTVLYGADGYVSATGTAATLLAFAADSDDNATSSEEGVRRLDWGSDKFGGARSKKPPAKNAPSSSSKEESLTLYGLDRSVPLTKDEAIFLEEVIQDAYNEVYEETGDEDLITNSVLIEDVAVEEEGNRK